MSPIRPAISLYPSNLSLALGLALLSTLALNSQIWLVILSLPQNDASYSNLTAPPFQRPSLNTVLRILSLPGGVPGTVRKII